MGWFYTSGLFKRSSRGGCTLSARLDSSARLNCNLWMSLQFHILPVGRKIAKVVPLPSSLATVIEP